MPVCRSFKLKTECSNFNLIRSCWVSSILLTMLIQTKISYNRYRWHIQLFQNSNKNISSGFLLKRLAQKLHSFRIRQQSYIHLNNTNTSIQFQKFIDPFLFGALFCFLTLLFSFSLSYPLKVLKLLFDKNNIDFNFTG